MPIDRCSPLDPDVMKRHREGKRTVACCGFAPTSREYIPFDDPNVDIWIMNECGKQTWIKRYDAVLQLHSRSNFMRTNNHNDPNHPDWLRQHHNKPIYMQKQWPDVPDSVRFPIEEYINIFGRYGTSSAAMMLGLAYILGYDRAELYGFEMASDSEYFYQKAGFEYVIGMCAGKGMEVWIDPKCSLLNAPLYGYQNMSIGFRTQLEIHKNTAKKGRAEAKDTALRIAGKLDLAQELSKTYPELAKVEADLQSQLVAANAQLNTWDGAMQQAETIMRLYDVYPFEQEMGDSPALETTDPVEMTQ